MFFTNKQQVYKSRTADFDDSKASLLGDFIPAKLEFESGETPIYMGVISEYKGYMLFVFENGRVAKVPLASYETKTNRKKLIKAYCEKFPIHSVMYIEEECDIMLSSTNGRYMIVNTALIPAKATKDNGGIIVMTQKRGQRIFEVSRYEEGSLDKAHRFRPRNLPSAGATPSTGEVEQLTF